MTFAMRAQDPVELFAVVELGDVPEDAEPFEEAFPFAPLGVSLEALFSPDFAPLDADFLAPPSLRESVR